MKVSSSKNINSEPGRRRNPDEVTIRPARFPIRTPFRYRESGAVPWRRGFTVDISRSGVLFQAEYTVAPKTILEMQIAFPPEMTGGVAASLFCCGPVLRCEARETPCAQTLLAACFFNYRFAPE